MTTLVKSPSLYELQGFGDGDRVIAIWKYLMLIFKAMGHRNYAAEAFTLLSQYHLTLPPNLAEQLKWSRFVNVHGLPGDNISCDLHQEHMNRLVKVAIEGLGANKKSSKAVIRVGKAVGLLAMICTVSGTMLRTSLRAENSFLKLLPLYK